MAGKFVQIYSVSSVLTTVILYDLINMGSSDALAQVYSGWGNGRGGLIIVCFCLHFWGTCQLNFRMEQQVVVQWTPTSFSNSFLVCSDTGKGLIPYKMHHTNKINSIWRRRQHWPCSITQSNSKIIKKRRKNMYPIEIFIVMWYR